MNKAKAVDIEAALAGCHFLEDRGETTEAEAERAFAELAELGNGGFYVGGFSGQSPWERHRNGDELVHVLKGAARLTIMHEDGPQDLEMSAGMIAVVPQGLWHRFQAPDGVTLMTATPQPTDHSFAEDPRTAG